jgi:hypothetical protein
MIPGSSIWQLLHQFNDAGTKLKQSFLKIVGSLAFFQHFISPREGKFDVLFIFSFARGCTFDVQNSLD